MNKTIENLAREYVKDVYGGDTDFIDEAENVLSWLFNKSLALRLTAEEKERVRKIYTECELIEMDDSPNLPADRITEAGAKMQVLESIFGTDFFKEGE